MSKPFFLTFSYLPFCSAFFSLFCTISVRKGRPKTAQLSTNERKGESRRVKFNNEQQKRGGRGKNFLATGLFSSFFLTILNAFPFILYIFFTFLPLSLSLFFPLFSSLFSEFLEEKKFIQTLCYVLC